MEYVYDKINSIYLDTDIKLYDFKNLINNDFFIIKDGKLLDSQTAKEIILKYGWKGIQIFPRIRGGGFLDIFGSILQIGKVFFFLIRCDIMVCKIYSMVCNVCNCSSKILIH